VVKGEVINIGADAKPSPMLRFGLRDGEAKEVQHVFASLDAASIPAGGATTFEMRIAGASIDAVDLEATFASPAEAAAQSGHAKASPHGEPLTLDAEAPANGHGEPSADGLAPRISEGWPAGEHG
jgi:hypothetical protein